MLTIRISDAALVDHSDDRILTMNLNGWKTEICHGTWWVKKWVVGQDFPEIPPCYSMDIIADGIGVEHFVAKMNQSETIPSEIAQGLTLALEVK